jgi:hypothetical protein
MSNKDFFPTREQGRLEWAKLIKKGYKPATYWHQCKRDWSENRD